MTNSQQNPSADGILAASKAIDPVFLNSPLIEQQSANAALGLRLFAKIETLNPIRSFKGRGTSWWLHNEPPGDTPIVSASAGNFGQGLAYAGRARGRRVVIFSATTANPGKVDAMRKLGAEVRLEGADFDAAKAHALAITPVPKGVGPMTIACLLNNTLKAFCLQNNLPVPEGV